MTRVNLTVSENSIPRKIGCVWRNKHEGQKWAARYRDSIFFNVLFFSLTSEVIQSLCHRWNLTLKLVHNSLINFWKTEINHLELVSQENIMIFLEALKGLKGYKQNFNLSMSFMKYSNTFLRKSFAPNSFFN